MSYMNKIHSMLENSIDFDRTDIQKLDEGLEKYLDDCGLGESIRAESDSKILNSFIERKLSYIAESYGSDTAMYFENYELIEGFRLFLNAVHATAQNGKASSSDIASIKTAFDDYFGKICAIPGLRAMLKDRISDGLIDLDRLQGISNNLGISYDE